MGTVVIERSFEAISVREVVDGGKLELRIHGESAKGDRTTFLTQREARILAFRLLAEAENIPASSHPA